MSEQVKAYAYLRVSSNGQIRGDGFPRQSKAIREYAQKHGIRLVKVFREEGISGTTEMENRPAFSEMLQALHRTGVRLVVVEKLDRLARDLGIQEVIISDFRKHGFELASVHEPDLLSEDPTRVLMRQVIGAVAQYEKTMITIKLRGARERKRAKTGRCEGRKPFGRTQAERSAIKRMGELRSQGMGYDRIAGNLNEEGVPTRSRGRWHGWAVNQILSRQQAKRRQST